MKSNRTTLLLVLSLALALAPGVRAQETVDLRLHLVKGDTRHITVTLEQTINQTVQAAVQTTTQRLAVTYTFEVTDADAQGNATVSVRYDAVAFHATMPGGGAVDYDSAQPRNGQSPPVASTLAALVGQGYSMVVTPEGTIAKVEGLPKMLESVLSRINLPEGPLRMAAERSVRQQLDEANLKQSLGDIFAPFPDHPVAVGQSWVRTREVRQGFPLKLETTYTLEKRDQGVATVKIAGSVATLPNAAMDAGPVKMNYSLKGKQDGSLEIDERSGWTRESKLTQDLSGSATVRPPNADPQTVPVTIHSIVNSAQKP